jgi:prepilin-type N-terminal cleavage/methylation domain-containing protein
MNRTTSNQSSGLRENRASMREGFTLIELLVVMGIIALLASVAIPSLKGIGSTNAISAANRQLLQDIEFARLRAMNERTTVYMVFVPPTLATKSLKARWTTTNEVSQAQRLLAGQFSSYALFAKRSLGDQPGAGTLRYLTEWKSLPDGIFIATNKFVLTGDDNNWGKWLGSKPGNTVTNWPFRYVTTIPFPLISSDLRALPDGLPCIAFNYQGQLEEPVAAPHDEYISLVKGSIVVPTSDPQGLINTFGTAAEVIQTPKDNSTNNPVIHIDWLTGRARSETRSF